MKHTTTALAVALGLAFAMPATLAIAADESAPAAAMDNSMSDKGTAEAPAKHHHKKHHHKPAHGSAPTSEDAKTNGMKHHHHHKKADTGAEAPAATGGEAPAPAPTGTGQ